MITVTPINDTLTENDETVGVTLSPNAAYVVGTPASASVTLTSEDGATPTPAVHAVSRVFDNKNGKAYWMGGPDGSEPADDLRSMTFDPLKVEVESGAGFWWEAEYEDPAATAVPPTSVKLIIDKRPEEGWSGRLTAEARSGVPPMLVSATDADVAVPLSRRTIAATPTVAQSCARRWYFRYDQPVAPPSFGTLISVSSSP